MASEYSRQTNGGGAKTLFYLRDRGQDARSDEALAVFIAEVEELSDSQLLLVIEDLRYISEGSSIAPIVESLLRLRPLNLKIILASRYPLPFNQAKLIAEGKLTVIRSTEVAFRLDETRAFLEKVLELNLSEEQTRYLHERTGGWIAAISLAADALQETSPENTDELFQRLTGFDGNIYDFFAEEAYEGLGTETKWLMKRIGLARTIRPEIVNLFTKRADGGQVLRDLARRNVFLIQDDSRAGNYRLHSLFAEFLEVRFNDEEGIEAIRNAHSCLAQHHWENDEWFLATEHAIGAQDCELAVQGLEMVAPPGVDFGYGQAVLSMVERVPDEWLNQSALLLETMGRAALQTSDLDLALDAFYRAQKSYATDQDETALDRVQFFIAETRLASGDMQPEEFVRTTHKIAMSCYEQNEILFGVQVESRLIAIGQTISAQYERMLEELVERSEKLVARLGEFGEEHALVKARILSVQAHLLFQVVTSAFLPTMSRIRMRQEMGHPVPVEERISLARTLIEGWQRVLGLYTEADNIAKEENEIEWAIIRLQLVRDSTHQMSLGLLITDSIPDSEKSLLADSLDAQAKDLLRGALATLQGCALIFEKYHMVDALARTYCEAADIYDILEDQKKRNKLAQKALDLASSKGLAEVAQRAQKILEDHFTFSSVRKGAERGFGDRDRDLASFDEEQKTFFLRTVLQAFAGDVDIDEIRQSLEADLDDMIAAARQRTEWCRHVQIIQDLSHTRSLETMSRTIPKKWIICMELGHESPTPGYAFDELWPMFKGVYCLTCLNRSLVE